MLLLPLNCCILEDKEEGFICYYTIKLSFAVYGFVEVSVSMSTKKKYAQKS